MMPVWRWPAIYWLLTGLPCGALGFGLDALAMTRGWWTDPVGLWSGTLTLVGVLIGAAVWFGLAAVSYRRGQS